MTEEQIPQWAVELTKQVTILNERLPNHITWTERNVLDHEKRLRMLEQFRWLLLGLAITIPWFASLILKMLGV